MAHFNTLTRKHKVTAQNKLQIMAYVEWAVKLLLVAGVSILFRLSLQMNDVINVQSQQGRDIEYLKNKVTYLESSTVTKSEQLETMKRIEQQMEIIMLKSKIEQTQRGKS